MVLKWLWEYRIGLLALFWLASVVSIGVVNVLMLANYTRGRKARTAAEALAAPRIVREFVDREVPVERVVEVERIVDRIVDRPVEVRVETVVEKTVSRDVFIERETIREVDRVREELATWPTVIDIIRALGNQPTNELCWRVGLLARKAHKARFGRLPDKSLRRKTSGSGSHDLAVYPEIMRAEIEALVAECVAAPPLPMALDDYTPGEDVRMN
jgi:hypothetical protein